MRFRLKLSESVRSTRQNLHRTRWIALDAVQRKRFRWLPKWTGHYLLVRIWGSNLEVQNWSEILSEDSGRSDTGRDWPLSILCVWLGWVHFAHASTVRASNLEPPEGWSSFSSAASIEESTSNVFARMFLRFLNSAFQANGMRFDTFRFTLLSVHHCHCLPVICETNLW